MKNIMIIGATSAIAQATARLFAGEGANLFLVARNGEKLRVVAEDLTARGAGVVETCVMDVVEYERHQSIIREAAEKMNGLDIVVIAHGILPDQKACEQSFDRSYEAFQINCLSTISLLTHAGNYFEQERGGTIAVISSVAGDRGRKSNYVYGATKGAIAIFLQGLRNRLQRTGVSVVTIKPGFVDTPMTVAFEKGTLWAQPGKVAQDIHSAIKRGVGSCYSPWYWRYIMMLIRAIPEVLFKRLSL